MTILKRFVAISIFLILSIIAVFNIQLHYRPEFAAIGKDTMNTDVLHQLGHIKIKMHEGAADQMQTLYPEGFVFLNVLYGLCWMEVITNLTTKGELYNEGLGEVNWALKELVSEKAKRPFSEDLSPTYGIFYRGWSNYLLGRKLKLNNLEIFDTTEIIEFHRNCQEIIESLENTGSPYLESYKQECWPADMTVAMASVAIHEELFPGQFQASIQNWLEKVENLVDKRGLIPHSSDYKTGKSIEPSRGSSQSLILNFLFEIDSAYGYEKFELYKSHFLDYKLGLPGIKEYANNDVGGGDIDSGPVIWGIGGAASIVGQRVMALYGEQDLAFAIRNSIEIFAFGKTFKEKKNYLFGKLPIADAFICWSNAVEANKKEQLTSKTPWGWQIHVLSFLVILIGGWAIFKLYKNQWK